MSWAERHRMAENTVKAKRARLTVGVLLMVVVLRVRRVGEWRHTRCGRTLGGAG